MKVIQIKNSYDVWDTGVMNSTIKFECWRTYGTLDASTVLNRTYKSMYIEWFLHNVCYYLTLPFVKNDYMHFLNKRFKDVDLEEYK